MIMYDSLYVTLLQSQNLEMKTLVMTLAGSEGTCLTPTSSRAQVS